MQALRGSRLIQAATIATEIAGIERFARAHALMGYLGLVPSEHSSADSRNHLMTVARTSKNASRSRASTNTACCALPRAVT